MKVESVFEELNGKRKLNVRPWNVRIGDLIKFYDSISDSEFLVEVTDEPMKMGRRYFTGKNYYKIFIKKIRDLHGHTFWNPRDSAWGVDEKIEVYRN